MNEDAVAKFLEALPEDFDAVLILNDRKASTEPGMYVLDLYRTRKTEDDVFYDIMSVVSYMFQDHREPQKDYDLKYSYDFDSLDDYLESILKDDNPDEED